VTVQRLVTGRVKLLLVGAGHAHLEILRRLAADPPGVELTVVSLASRQHYSGMVPGYVQGTYSEGEISVDVPRLAARSGGRFVAGRAVAVDPGERRVRLASGDEIPYDLASFAVGSEPAGADDPAVAGRALAVKPLARVVELRSRLLELAAHAGEGAPAGDSVAVAVVGGGAAGVEIALAAARVLDDARIGRRVTILEDGPAILAGYTERFRARAAALLAARGVEVRLGTRAAGVEEGAVATTSGERVAADLAVWLTGAVAQPLFQGSGLAVDERGFLLLDDSLRAVSDPRLFAAGDCGTLARFPETPKAGVYAVREAPVLWGSLVAAIHGTPAPRYRPQAGFLSLLNTADGRALLAYKGRTAHARWAWRLKDWIDRRFVGRYR
jgi:pyridine nucleotide-disulfide oxidoreductase family protein